MALKCPHCQSQNIRPLSIAKQSASMLGGLAGIAYGLSGLFRGARTGAAICAPAGPVGITFGGVAGALVSAVLTGSAGYAVGSLAGNQLDKRVLRNHGCDDCGGVFKVEEVAVPQFAPPTP